MDSTPESELWVICSVCQQANPEGRQFCRYCWGTIISSGNPPLPYEEAKEISKRRLSRLKRRKLIRAIAIRLVYLTVLASVVVFAYIAVVAGSRCPAWSLQYSKSSSREYRIVKKVWRKMCG